MARTNTAGSFGSVTRTLHWLTALLIITAIPLGLIANALPYDTSEALARKAMLFSAHKTLGVAAFLVGVTRILWAVTQPRPAPLHPERRLETAMAEAVHWTLYISLVAVPLSGWVHHAATTGFAPILWPFGQTLPFVPQSPAVEHAAASAHWVFTKLLAASILLHIAGALKHHLIDRDATLRRMTRGTVTPGGGQPHRPGAAPIMAALAIYLAGAGLAVSLSAPQAAETPAPAQTSQTAQTAQTGNWTVQQGNLAFTVAQMGADVQGRFADWTADITFDETPTDGSHGTVTVTIQTASLTLGSVSDQAKGADFLNVSQFPTATFTADLRADGAGYVADGTLSLLGQSQPLRLPFSLTLTGDSAKMTGSVTLDRRSFGIGASYPDEASVGFAVTVAVDLTATR